LAVLLIRSWLLFFVVGLLSANLERFLGGLEYYLPDLEDCFSFLTFWDWSSVDDHDGWLVVDLVEPLAVSMSSLPGFLFIK